MMDKFKIGNILTIIDNADGKERECKIVQVDEHDAEVRVHYIGWNKDLDEWLSIKSPRIVLENGKADANDSSSKNVNPIEQRKKEIIGKIIYDSGEATKKILTAFEIDASFIKNEKALMKFPVSLLEACSEDMLIIIFDKMGKKMFNKKSLVKRLIDKFNGLLPSKCDECSEIYSLELKDNPLFICNECQRGSHDCHYLKEFKSSLTGRIPKGFIWLCFNCCSEHDIREEDNSYINGAVDVSKTSSDSKSDPVDESISDKDTSNMVIKNTDIPGLDIIRNESICKKYKRGICPHGIRGNKIIEGDKCLYSHPKPCRRYCSFGSKDRNGCRNGASCNFYHPVLCKFSLKYWSCINEKCTFVHLKGTQRRAENIRSNFENIKPSFENNTYVSPTTDAKNDPLSRIEDMIGKLRGDYEKEMNLVRAEFRYFKNESMHYGQHNPRPSEQDKQTFYRTTFPPRTRTNP